MTMTANTFARVLFASTLACNLGACQADKQQSGSSANAPKTKVNPAAVQARAQQPPPSNATQKSSIGEGKTSVQTANASGDTDSYWVELIDIDGDGDFDQTELLWDDEDKVLFAYAEVELPCTSGGTAYIAILVCVNGADNPRKRPAGSGFYAAYFDESECSAGVAGLFGCTFDATGYVTAWAEAVVDSDGDQIVFVGAR